MQNNKPIEVDIISHPTPTPINNAIADFNQSLQNIANNGTEITLSISGNKKVLTTNNGNTTEVFTHQILGGVTSSSHTISIKGTIKERQESVQVLSANNTQSEMANILGVSQSTICKDVKEISNNQ